MGEVTAVRGCPNHQISGREGGQEGGGVDSDGDSGIQEHVGLTLKMISPQYTGKGFLQISLLPHLQSYLKCPDKLQFGV